MSVSFLQEFLNITRLKTQPDYVSVLFKTANSKNITIEEWNTFINQFRELISQNAETYLGFKHVLDALNSFEKGYPIYSGDTLPDKLPDNYIQLGAKSNASYNPTDKFRVVLGGVDVLNINSQNDLWAANNLRARRALELGTGETRATLLESDLHSLLDIHKKVFRNGTGNYIRRKGYYYEAIDFTKKIISLSLTQKYPVIGVKSENSNFTTPSYEVGDKLSIVNNRKDDFLITVKAIHHNLLEYEGNLPYSTILDATGNGAYELDIDDYSISVPERPESGEVYLKDWALAIGDGNSSFGLGSGVFGRYNLGFGDFSLTSGLGNYGGYCCIVGGTNNYGVVNYGIIGGAENTAVRNKYNEPPTSIGVIGKNHTFSGSYGYIGGNGNTVDGEKGLTVGAGNTVTGDECLVGGGSNEVTAARNVQNGTGNKCYTQRNVQVGNGNTINTGNSYTYDGITYNPGANVQAGQGNITNCGNGLNGGLKNTVNNANSSLVVGDGNNVSGNSIGIGRHIVGGKGNTVGDIENIVNGEGHTVTSARTITSGQRNTVKAKHTLNWGQDNVNNVANSAVGGYYAKQSNNALLTLGNGTASATSNAFEVLKDNSIVLGTTKLTEAQLKSLIALI